MTEKERPSITESVDSAPCTGRLMRITHTILMGIPDFTLKAGATKFLGNEWVGFERNGFYFAVKSSILSDRKVLLGDLPDNRSEVVQFVYTGVSEELDLNQSKNFSGLTYIFGSDRVEMLYEEDKTYRAEYMEPLVGEEAELKAKELIKALI